jgi:hypothetical protein
MRSQREPVPKHEDFENICAAASLGKATPQDLLRLEQHVLVCASCRQAYHDDVSAAAYEFAALAPDPKLSLKEAKECLDSELFMRRWFDRAQREGIEFSEEVRRPGGGRLRTPLLLSPGLLWREYATPMAAAVLVVLALSTGYLYWKTSSSGVTRDRGSHGVSSVQSAMRATELESANQALMLKIDRLNRELADATDKLSASEASGKKAMAQERKDLTAERELLRAQSLRLQNQLLAGQNELFQLQTLAANDQKDADEQRKRAGDLEANLVASQAELNNLTGKLKDESAALTREHELLAMGRDVTDLMGARNLHILDVVDTDTRGKTRPAFGRIFFTEGKSLVFYAYDLNEAKMQKANYQYQVWAKKEGPDRPVRRLGVFYSDDKAQNRWVFKCDDANVVKEIDSVFVTLGRPNSDATRPEGSPLMFAYLHGAPNHP